MIVAQDEEIEGVALVLSGALKISVFSDAGAERILDLLGPGSFFGEESLVGGRILGVTVTALEETCLLAVPAGDALRLVGDDRDFLLAVVGSLVGKLHRRGRQLVDAAFGDACSQVASALLFLKRTGRDGAPPVTIHATQQQIADLLGLSRVTVANALARLEHGGVVRRQARRVAVTNGEALRRLARRAARASAGEPSL